jgi:hypothetical protein
MREIFLGVSQRYDAMRCRTMRQLCIGDGDVDVMQRI